MKLKDFLKLFENEDPEIEIVISAYEQGDYTKTIEVIESFVATDDFDNDIVLAYRDYLINLAIKNGKDPIRVLRIS